MSVLVAWCCSVEVVPDAAVPHTAVCVDDDELAYRCRDLRRLRPLARIGRAPTAARGRH